MSTGKKSYLSDLSAEKIDQLFRDLDENHDGTIDIKDLTAALNRLRVPQLPKHAETFIRVHDKDNSGDISYGEFVRFVYERQMFLKSAFERFDRDHDGQISFQELKSTFRDAGVELSTEEYYDMLEKLDRHKSLTISWNDWLEFFLLNPGTNKPSEFFHYWNHAMIDVGEAGLIPPDDFDARLRLIWRNLVAGAVAGAVSRTATAPIDRLKIFLQVYGERHQIGILSGCMKLLHEGGFLGMFRGNFVNVLKIAPETAVKFACFERIKKLMSNANLEIGPVERFVAGSTAGALAQSSIYPMEVIKTRLALGRTGEYNGISDCARLILKREGLRSFYRGFVPSVLGIVPYAGTDLAVYETLRSFYSRNGHEPTILVTLLCGVVSSTAAQLASFPFNVLRTIMQSKANLGNGRDTMSDLALSIWRAHGIRGLYRGLTPSIMKTAPAISITYVVYEQVRKQIGVQ